MTASGSTVSPDWLDPGMPSGLLLGGGHGRGLRSPTPRKGLGGSFDGWNACPCTIAPLERDAELPAWHAMMPRPGMAGVLDRGNAGRPLGLARLLGRTVNPKSLHSAPMPCTIAEGCWLSHCLPGMCRVVADSNSGVAQILGCIISLGLEPPRAPSADSPPPQSKSRSVSLKCSSRRCSYSGCKE